MIALLKAAALKDDVELQDHQRDAIEHSKGKPGTILSHGTGSGKTVTSLGIAEEQGGNTLAVTPASLTENYEKEVEKFVEDDRQDAHRAVSYSKFRKDPQKYLDEHDPDTMVLDETHRLRNPTKARKAVREARPQVDKAVGLSASLVNNHPREVAPLTNTVVGDKVLGQEEFDRKFLETKKESPGILGKLRGADDSETEHLKNEDELKERLGPYIHHHDPDQSGEEYPDVEEEEVEVPMSKKQERLIKGIEKSNPALSYKMRRNLPPSKKETKNLNAFMQAMRQVSNTPATHDETIDDPVEHSPKMQKLVENLGSEDEDYRGVAYSNYLGAGAEPVIDEAEDAGLYHGSLTDNQREELLGEFEQGDKKVLGLSPAGGEGIDLKGVQDMHVLEPDWNPETTRQAVGRAARYKSHEHLPEDKQKVNIKKYKSTYPDKLRYKLPGVDKPTSPDQYLSSVQEDKDRLNQEFYDAIE